MNYRLITLGLLLTASNFCFSISPDSNNGGSIVGICGLCAVENPSFAMDGNLSTFQNYNLSASISAYGTTTYSFNADIPSSSLISIVVSYPDLAANSFGGLLGATAFGSTTITLLDDSDNVIEIYNSGAQSAVEVIDDAQNMISIKLINPYSDVRKIVFTSGALVSFVGDVRLHEISYEPESFIFADRNLTSGYFDGANLVNTDAWHLVNNPTHATYDNSNQNFDVNSEFTSFSFTLAANIVSEYLYATYDWSGVNYSGLDNDVYLMMADANLATVADMVWYFDSDLIEVIVGYSDGTYESFATGNPLIKAETQVVGDGRFYLQIDIDDLRMINDVEVRFKPITGAQSELKLFTIFLSTPVTGNPLPVEYLGLDVACEDKIGDIDWASASEVNCDSYRLRHLSADFEELRSYEVPGAGTTSELSNYNVRVLLQNEISYVELSQLDFDGNREMLDFKALKPYENNTLIYPNPSFGEFQISTESDETFILSSVDGTEKREVVSGETISCKAGVYVLLDENGQTKGEKIVVLK